MKSLYLSISQLCSKQLHVSAIETQLERKSIKYSKHVSVHTHYILDNLNLTENDCIKVSVHYLALNTTTQESVNNIIIAAFYNTPSASHTACFTRSN